MNPYPQRFLNLLADCEEGSVVLDLGAGGRIPPDGVIGMEFVETPNNHVQGDVMNLPFGTGTVDLILSQAVLEHVIYPDEAVKEMFRVLKPYGILYVEIAFMQPLHMDPWHYFNVTPRGLTWLLRNWEVKEQGTLGSWEDVMEWLYREVGIRRSPSQKQQDKRAKPPAALYERVAYGVYATAQKPGMIQE